MDEKRIRELQQPSVPIDRYGWPLTGDALNQWRQDRSRERYLGTGASLNDRSLLAAYQRTDGEPGNSEADALLAEISRRNLDL